MLRIVDNPTFSREVTARVPVEGGWRDENFKATFNVIPIDETDDFDVGTPGGTYDFLCRAIVSLDDIIDGEKVPLDYNDELRDRVLQLSYVRRALFDAYIDGVKGARAGN